MARDVRHEERGPAIMTTDDLGDDGRLFVCLCGLSDTRPLCDGSHRATEDEKDGVVYRYDVDGENGRRIAESERDG